MTHFRIPIIGDVHLGPNARQPQRLEALATITRAGHLLENLGAWFYVGDLFDTDSRPEDRNILAAILTDQANVAPVVIVKGNHDKEGDLEIFAKLRTIWPIHVCETAQVLELLLATGQRMTIGTLPWPSEASLVAAGVSVAGIKDAARPALQAILLDQGQALKAAADVGRPVAWLAHATVTGAIASNGQPQVGTGIELDEELLGLVGRSVPKFLGHIHKPQTINGSACYVGSICRLDFGEVERKRYLVLEGESLTNFCDQEIGPWDYNAEDVTLDVPGLWHVEAELGQVDAIVVGQPPVVRVLNIQITKGPDGTQPPAEWVGQEVRFRLRYPVALRAALAEQTDYLRTMFAKARRFQLETIAIPDTGLRAPAVANAPTIEGKVRAWADTMTVRLPDHLPEALELLCHNEPDGVLADVQAMVDELLKEGQPNAA